MTKEISVTITGHDLMNMLPDEDKATLIATLALGGMAEALTSADFGTMALKVPFKSEPYFVHVSRPTRTHPTSHDQETVLLASFMAGTLDAKDGDTRMIVMLTKDKLGNLHFRHSDSWRAYLTEEGQRVHDAALKVWNTALAEETAAE